MHGLVRHWRQPGKMAAMSLRACNCAIRNIGPDWAQRTPPAACTTELHASHSLPTQQQMRSFFSARQLPEFFTHTL